MGQVSFGSQLICDTWQLQKPNFFQDQAWQSIVEDGPNGAIVLDHS